MPTLLNAVSGLNRIHTSSCASCRNSKCFTDDQCSLFPTVKYMHFAKRTDQNMISVKKKRGENVCKINNRSTNTSRHILLITTGVQAVAVDWSTFKETGMNISNICYVTHFSACHPAYYFKNMSTLVFLKKNGKGVSVENNRINQTNISDHWNDKS